MKSKLYVLLVAFSFFLTGLQMPETALAQKKSTGSTSRDKPRGTDKSSEQDKTKPVASSITEEEMEKQPALFYPVHWIYRFPWVYHGM